MQNMIMKTVTPWLDFKIVYDPFGCKCGPKGEKGSLQKLNNL